MYKILTLVFIISTLFTMNLKARETPVDNPLTGKKWVATQLPKGMQVEVSGDLTAPFLIFTNDNKISGSASCNKVMGSYESDGKYKIEITALTTRMMCENMRIETAFLSALEKANNFSVSGNTLMLQSGKMLLAIFEGAQLETTLENNEWLLYELVGKPVEKGSVYENYTLNFLEDKKVSAKVCNILNGTFKTNDGNALKINLVVSTMMACPELDTETLFKDALGLVSEYQIDENNDLILKNGSVVLAKFRLAGN